MSVDTKKKELVGATKNAGQQWPPVLTHDFPYADTNNAIPYGICGPANTRWLSVGTDDETAVFAVESLRRWWKTRGSLDFPAASRLLITADAAGSNGYQTRVWKAELAALALGTGLEITVCHFPPGTLKWNKIECRLLSHNTMSWRGKPLTSHEVVVNSIAAATNRTGPAGHAKFDIGAQPPGVKVGNRQVDALPLTRHTWRGDGNYILRPDPYSVINEDPDPFHQPSPDLVWLQHPVFTGLNAIEWDALIVQLITLHDAQREGKPDKRRDHRPRIKGGRTNGRRSILTLADRLIAVILHQRLGLPQVAIARAFGVTPETINRRIRDIRQLLQSVGHTVEPTGARLADLDCLHDLATSHGITINPDAFVAVPGSDYSG